MGDAVPEALVEPLTLPDAEVPEVDETEEADETEEEEERREEALSRERT